MTSQTTALTVERTCRTVNAMVEYIPREAVVMGVLGLTIVDPMVAQYADAVLHQIHQVPTADVVPRVAYDQVAWERDMAIQQLREDYGVGLGEKKPVDVVEVVRGRWKKIGAYAKCTNCGTVFKLLSTIHVFRMNNKFCRTCGARMDGGG